MVELFADLPPDHEYFSQFSFIAPEDLPTYRTLLSAADPARSGPTCPPTTGSSCWRRRSSSFPPAIGLA